jgi:CDP-diacylglycerol--serine O-phosphatidyltransferase
MVTSGVVPGLTMYFMLSNSVYDPAGGDAITLFPFVGFAITLGACYRLAKFNIDERQSDSFIGLPTPANALFIVSLPLIRNDAPLPVLDILVNPYALTVITLFSAWIMNAEVPLFSLKIKKFSFAAYSLQFIFVGISALLLIFLRIMAIPLVILFYVLLSIARNKMAVDAKETRE